MTEKTTVKWTRLSVSEIKRAQEAAKRLSKSLSSFIREAVNRYLVELGL